MTNSVTGEAQTFLLGNPLEDKGAAFTILLSPENSYSASIDGKAEYSLISFTTTAGKILWPENKKLRQPVISLSFCFHESEVSFFFNFKQKCVWSLAMDNLNFMRECKSNGTWNQSCYRSLHACKIISIVKCWAPFSFAGDDMTWSPSNWGKTSKNRNLNNFVLFNQNYGFQISTSFSLGRARLTAGTAL